MSGPFTEQAAVRRAEFNETSAEKELQLDMIRFDARVGPLAPDRPEDFGPPLRPAVQFAPPRTTPQRGPGRLLSCAHTIEQVRRRKKTQTRRIGWWKDKRGNHLVRPGDRLQLVRKAMGRKPGEPVDVLAVVEVTEVRREPLNFITREEVAAEGFPEWAEQSYQRWHFVRFFTRTFGVQAAEPVTVITWRYLDGEAGR